MSVTKYQALYNWWASHGVPAFEENSVPDQDTVVYPYIAYQAASGDFVESTTLNASIYTKSTSWAEAIELADSIQAELKNGGTQVPYTGGTLWITLPRGRFSETMGDPDDDRVKRVRMTIIVNYH